MTPTRRKNAQRAAITLSALSVCGCFASPDLSQIACKSDRQCAPGYQCDLTRNKCQIRADGGLTLDGQPQVIDAGGESKAGLDGGDRAEVPSVDVVPVADAALAGEIQIETGIVATDTAELRDAPVTAFEIGTDLSSDLRPPPAPDVGSETYADTAPDTFSTPDAVPDSPATTCTIAGSSYASDQTNPTNPCQLCKLTNPTAWSTVDEGTGCPGSGKYCSAGICKTGCFIGGTFYADSAVNGCQVCKASSPTVWTTQDDGASCGAGKVCSSGACTAGCWANGTLVSEGQSKNCSAFGATGTCATGTRTCTAGQLSSCSIQPAAQDTCTPGNDDNCNGTPNDTACKAIQIVAGGTHTCALLSDGMVRCWGEGGSGQLGNGSSSYSAKPVLVSGLANVAFIAAGTSNTCAISASGTISCWGDNQAGQLAISPSAKTYSSTPVAISTTESAPASTVTIGTAHVCYLATSDKTVMCWGQSQYGRLGNGTTSAGAVTTPAIINGLANVTSVSAGATHTCASLSDLSVRCWGQDNWGQIGDGVSSGPSATPAVVNDHGYPLAQIMSVSSGNGGSHICALRNDGQAQCWGRADHGQVGAGAAADIAPVVPVVTADGTSNYTGLVSMSSGSSHTCAVLSDGTAVCWGENNQGQLGNPSSADAYTPVPVSNLTGVSAISAGGLHTCALLTNGSVKCWGFNNSGQLGDSTTDQRTAPVAVKNLLP
jgi:alpha-tubulin suppressor-like RCC1 family protein